MSYLKQAEKVADALIDGAEKDQDNRGFLLVAMDDAGKGDNTLLVTAGTGYTVEGLIEALLEDLDLSEHVTNALITVLENKRQYDMDDLLKELK